MFVSNRVSHLDHIVFHLAAGCVTVSLRASSLIPLAPFLLHVLSVFPLIQTSVSGRGPIFYQLFDHHVFSNEQDGEIVGEAKQLPEFDGEVAK